MVHEWLKYIWNIHLNMLTWQQAVLQQRIFRWDQFIITWTFPIRIRHVLTCNVWGSQWYTITNVITSIWWWWFMVFNATFNNISVVSWRSVLLVEETGVPGENHRPLASHWQTLSHNVVSSTPRHERGSNAQL